MTVESLAVAPPPQPQKDLPREDEVYVLPASFAQRRLWFLDRLSPGVPLYDIPWALRLEGRLRVPLLARALALIAERHEVLRTTFDTLRGELVQVIRPWVEVPLPVVDLSGLRRDRRETELARLAGNHARHVFDLARGPLFSVRLVRLARAGEDGEHALLLNLHHVIGDAWSADILVGDLGTLYRRLLAGTADPLAELPELEIQYADYAQAQLEWLQGEVLEAGLAHWRPVLEGVEPLPLPADRPRGNLPGAPGSRRRLVLEPAVAEALEGLGRASDATFFMVLLAGVQAFLARVTGRDDVAVGTVTAGRGKLELEGVLGCFVNTLVLRTRLDGDPGFREVLARARATAVEAFGSQDVPFEKLVEELRPDRDLGHTPFFDVLLTVQDTGTSRLELPGLTISALAAPTGTAKFDWSLAAERRPDGLELSLAYRTDRFDATTVERALRQLGRFLASAIREPDRPVSRLGLLGRSERHHLLAEWADGPAAVGASAAATLHGLVLERLAARRGDLALLAPDGDGGSSLREVSAGELLARIAAMAHRLRAVGVTPEEVVAVRLDRSVDLVAALVGVLAAGAAFLAVDPDDPPERAAFVLADAGVRHLVTRPGREGGLGPDLERIEPVGPEDAGVEAVTEPPAVPVLPDHLAYVLYTSGSTGTPRGSLVSHRAVVATLGWLLDGSGGAAEGERAILKTPVSFDVAVRELFWPLAAGVPVVVAAPGEHRDPEALARRMEAAGVTSVHFVPSVLAAWSDTVASGGAGIGSLRRVFAGGETLAPDLARRVDALLPAGGRSPRDGLFNQYGLTETAVTVLSHRVAEGEPVEEMGTVPLGRPGTGRRVLVLDRSLEPVPVGVAGEVVVGGGLARGYLGRPAATAERFVPDPGSGLRTPAGARLYRTGDLGRRLADGEVDFLGRADQQIKVRGVRVEPAEVEAVLARHPAVAAVAAVAAAGRLAAAVVARPGQRAPGARELVAVAAEHLPGPLVPSLVTVVDRLPRTASGKVDRRAVAAAMAAELGAAGGVGGRRAAAPRVPRGPVEEVLLDLWRQVLGRDDLGVDDDFFDVGGHSLLATQLTSRVRSVLGRELPLRVVFERPTVGAMARYLTAASTFTEAPPIRPEPRDPAAAAGRVQAPASFAQQRLWFLDRLVPGNAFYNMPAALRLVGPLDRPALARAFAALVARHESLRTTFSDSPAGPVQVIAPPAASRALALPVVDLARLPAGRRRAELGRRMAGEGRRPFDLESGPLLRLALVRTGAEDHTLLATVHHIVSDGWSQGILAREAAALYRAETRGASAAGPPPLPPLPVQYADFALWQRRWLGGEVTARLLGYWRERLEGLPETLPLPFDRPRPPVARFRGAVRSFVLDAELTPALARFGRGAGATLSMVLLAGFKAVLARASGEDDVAVGVAVANRNRVEVEPLIGFFVNTLVLRTDLAGADLAGLVGRVREASLAAYAHQDLPFERLVEELAPERSLGHNPLIQVMYGFQNFPRAELRVDDVVLTAPAADAGDSGSSKFDLTLFLYEEEGALHGLFQYNRDLFDGVTLARLARHLESLLRVGLEAPERPVASLGCLAPAERHQVTVELAAPAAAPDPRLGAGLPALLAAQVERTPDAVAVEALAADGAPAADGPWTYRRLARRARRLAQALGRAGVGPGGRVGLAARRSPSLVAAMAGIVEAGAAYVPLDPEYPRERLAFMVDDAELAALVGDRDCLAVLAPALAAPGDGPWRPLPRLVLEEVLREAPGDEGGDEPPRAPAVDGDGAAYVIYTSGSTGRPKGVEVVHRAVARLAFDGDLARSGARTAQAASASFDAITFEVWAPLLTGGTAVIVPKELALFPPRLAAALRSARVETLFLTTALFNQVVREEPDAFSPLSHLLFGGEAVDPRSVRSALAAGAPRRLLHVYGPTETTTFASRHPVAEVADGSTTVPIGGPIAGTTLHVLDAAGRAVALGVAGELVVGGAGVARGYASRPRRTAESFVPDPFAGPGSRLYRTGDVVRRRQDGAVEFVGRVDHQVKLRGFRIELGEIEAALGDHPAVAGAVVAVRADVGEAEDGDRRLVAYVTQEPGWRPACEGLPEATPSAGAAPESDEAVAGWSMIFDDLYGREAPPEDPTFNVVGWDSTYTGEPLPAHEMRSWLDDTVERIRGLAPPGGRGGRVLEIGCGTGLLLLRLAPDADLYVGTDVSASALAYVREHMEAAGGLDRVHLLRCPADRLAGVAEELGLAPEAGALDTVVLNSVVQYFPSAEYLAQVLEGAARLLAPGGSIFVGDVRSLPLLDAFHASVALHRAVDDAPLAAVRAAWERLRLEENELALDPAFFAAVGARLGLPRVSVHPKRGRFHNELTGFRYQVVLGRAGRRDEAGGAVPAAVERWEWCRDGLDGLDGLDCLDMEGLAGRLRRPGSGAGEALVVAGLPNARTAAAVAARRGLEGAAPAEVETAADLRRWAAAAGDGGGGGAVDPQELLELGEGLGWRTTLGWGAPGSDGRFDALFLRGPDGDGRAAGGPSAESLLPPPPVPAGVAPERFANRPLQGRFARLLEPELRAHLAERLPPYMVPSAFVLLAELPLNPNGKVDRRRLPAPDRRGPALEPGDGLPEGPVEQAVARILADLLGIERIGAESDFFDLGGHSLLATRAVSRLRRELGVEIPLRTLFEGPTVRALAAAVVAAERTSAAAAAAPPLVPADRAGGDPPLSHAQERLWFLAALDPAATAYNEAASLRLSGALDLRAFAAALAGVVARHEVLRTSFPEVDGAPVQRIAPAPARVPLPVVDLGALPGDRRETEVRSRGAELRRRPYDLRCGPLLRTALFRLEPSAERVVVFGFHHIVFDGWSLAVFARELSALYRHAAGPGTTAGPPPLPPLPVQYADFAVWQRGWLTGEVLSGQLDHWRRALAGLPVLELPTDRPRASRPSPRGASVPLVLDADLAERLREVGRRRGATLFMVLAAGVEALLARMSGQEDFALGTPVANRTRSEIEPLVGFFVNMLVLRADLSGDPSFAALVERSREAALAAYAHQDLPFERLASDLVPDRDLGRNPLFQVGFQVFNAEPAVLELPGAAVEPFPLPGRGAKFDLDVAVTDPGPGASPEPLRGSVVYDASLFDATTVERLARGLVRLLRQAAAEPERRLAGLDLLSPAEAHQVIREWGAAPAPAPAAEPTLHGLVLAAARRTPHAVAVAAAPTSGGGPGSEVRTYGQIVARAGALARRLAALEVGVESRVGVCLEATADRPAAFLSVLLAGGAFVPIDPSLPAARQARLALAAGLRVVIAAAGWREALAAAGEDPGPVAVVDPAAEDGAGATSERRVPATAAAYVVYTSGSTGAPKGVVVSHRSVAAFVAAAAERFGVAPGARFLQAGSIGFDVSVLETFVPLAAGAAVVVAERSGALDAADLERQVAASRVTALAAVPSLAELLEPDRLPAVDTAIFGGDRCPAELVERWAGRRVWNAYGPTEATVLATLWRAGHGRRGAARGETPPIGGPQAPARATVADREGRAVPPGVVGELLLGGAGLARGYLGRPAETAAVFVPDPLAPAPGGRRYRTGDLVRWQADGALRFEGRADHQVKVRGVRLELGEVEAVLADHPAVAEAAADLVDGRLVAWVTAAGGSEPDAAVLRDHAARRLPAAAVPVEWRLLRRLPRTATSGKVDRRALARTIRPASEGEGGVEAGRRLVAAPAEAALPAASAGGGALAETVDLVLGAWRDVLGTGPVRPDSDFFALGGHSLLAIRLLGRLRSLWGVEVPVRTLFENPTPAALAAAVDSLVRRRGGAPVEAIPRAGERERWPLTSSQRRLWILAQADPASAAYNMPLSVRLDGELDARALAAALRALVARHEVLATRFAVGPEGEPVALLDGPRRRPLPVVDLGGLGAAAEAALRRLARAEHRRPFDLARGPLLRTSLVRLAPRRHALLATAHHVAADGWSLEVLLADLAALYRARSGGVVPSLPELPIRFVDLAVWEERWLAAGGHEPQLDHWRRALSGVRPLELPAELQHPRRRTSRGDTVPVRLPAGTSRRLEALGRERGATAYMVALAGFAAFLSRVTGREDVAVGSPIANRDRPELEGLVGFLVNMLVLRTPVRPGGAFDDLVETARTVALDAYAHRDLPFEILVESLDPLDAGGAAGAHRERSLARNPLFQVALQVLPGGRGTVSGGRGAARATAADGLAISPLAAGAGLARFDLYLSLRAGDGGEGIAGTLEYSADLFTDTGARRLARHLETLLAAAAAEPSRAVQDLPLLTDAERHELLVELADTGRPYAAERGLHRLTEARAAERPDALAVVFGRERLTYGDLDARAARLARELAARGVVPGDRVALALERSADLVVAMLAASKAGAAYVPLDPDHPRDRLEAMVADARVGAVVVSRAAGSGLDGLAAGVRRPVVDLAGDRERIAARSPEPLAWDGGGDHPAYVIYTSGSTGRPKGVVVSHRAVARLVTGADYVVLGPDDRVAQLANASFDAATFEVWGALAAGARVVGIGTETALDPRRLAATLEAEGVTTLFVTTALFNRLVREEPGIFRRLTHLLFGGEAVDPRAVRRLLESGPPRRLLHVYGPTETTTFATWQRVTRVAEDAETVPIGAPIANTRALVLDRRLEPVPAGVVGELHLAGPGLAQGYLGRPAATAAAFVPDPSAGPGGAGSRLYRTGDRVRRRSAGGGAMEFVGRTDAQVKLRGFRVEPGEVEVRLRAHPAVADAAVVPWSGGPSGEARLVAYVVPGPGPDRPGPTPEVLRAHCRERLPAYMVPSAFVRLDALPLTANGKLDRAALPAPAAADYGLEDAADAAPGTPVEQALADVWEEVLGVAPGVHDDFFDAGGHSLSAVQVISRVRQTLGAEVTLRSLFESPTLAGFAREVEAALGAPAARAAAPPLVPVDRTLPQPLSFAQQRLWVLDQLEPGNVAYNMPMTVRLDGELHVPVLARTLAEILRRHEVLRTVFGWRDGEPVQEADPWDGLETVGFPVTDLRSLDPGRASAEARRLAAEEAARPFDLEMDPMVRLGLVRLPEGSALLLCTLHHIVSDGWSLALVQRELTVLYRAFLEGRRPGPDELPELPVQYADYAVWQRRVLSGETLERELDHWREALDGLPDLDLPTDRPRGAVPDPRGRARSFALASPDAEALTAVARRRGATPFMAYLALWHVLLARLAGQWDFAVGTPVANRTRPEIEPLIGFFVNTLVLRARPAPEAGFESALDAVREAALRAFVHQEMPFQTLVAELVSDRRGRRSPLFQAFFVLQNVPRGEAALPGLTLERLPAEVGAAKFELSLSLTEAPEGLAGVLEYATALFDASTVARLVGQYRALVAAAAADPGRPVAALPLLTPAQGHQLLAEWNDTAQGRAADRSVAEVFEARAAERPDAVALVSTSHRLSYRELDRRANRLAHRLRHLGVGPEEPVTLLLEPSFELVVSELAVLKSGAAYVPLGTGYPTQRLDLLLEDMGAQVVLTCSGLAARLPRRPGLRVVDLDADGLAPMGLPDAPPPSLPGAGRGRALAYAIFTSGSTGRPKGVEVTHEGIVRLVRHAPETLAVGAEDRLLMVTPVTFDVSTYEVWGALLNGASLGVLEDPVPSLEALGRAVRDLEVTVLWLTSGLFALMVDQRLDDLRGLRAFLAGGDAVPVQQARRVVEELPGCRLVNGYGPTENTTFTTSHRATQESVSRASLPIGRPVHDTETHVVDPWLRPVAPGVRGELVTGGAGLARGYLGRPAATAAAFVPDAFGRRPGGRLYRTGDLVRAFTDGSLEFLGRLDHQVKIRGFRVEPDEVQSVLGEHPSVAEAVVVAREVRRGDRRLVAYVVPTREAVEAASDATREVEALSEWLDARLPDYMVPAAFVVLDALPLTAHGKVDRAALPAPDAASREGASRYVAPRTDLERSIARVWSEVLGVAEVGVHDSFFDLGGHSLLLLQATGRIGETLGRELPRNLMFEHPTVAALARALEALPAPGGSGEDGVAPGAGEAPPAAATTDAVERARARAERRRSSLGRRGGGGRGAAGTEGGA